MARHSHWHNIQVTKVKADAKRAKIFSRFTRAIVVAAREGGGDPLYNVRLRVAIESARANSVPRENIDRAVLRGTGADGGAVAEEVVYEAYAPGGVAMLIVCTTDNRNRTSGDVKNVVTKYGGTVAMPGSVLWMFDKKGQVTVNGMSDALELAAIDGGADDVETEDDNTYVTCDVPALKTVLEALEKVGATIADSCITYIPKTTTAVADPDALQTLVDKLDDLDDVDEVHVNAE